jgi:ligand-binding sensor domain-containing protein
LENGLYSTRIQELLAASDGTLWVATVAGISHWHDHHLEPVSDAAVSNIRCRALAEDNRGRVWIGTDNGVVVYENGKYAVLRLGKDSKGTLVRDILADHEGVLVAADNGLWLFPWGGEPFTLSGPPKVDPASFRALAITAEGLWLGTYNEGIWLHNDSGWHRQITQTVSSLVYRMTVEPSGTLYIATNDGDLFLKRPGHTTLEHWGVENGLPSNVVSVVLEDRESNLWIGTDIGGLAVINHTEKQGLPSACVFGISPGGTADSLWLGTMHGAVHYQVRPQPKVLETLRAGDGLGNEWVWKVLCSADGTLWLMTDSDLRYRRSGEKTIRALPPAVPVPRTVLLDIAIDGQGNFWAAGEWSGGGLARRDAKGRWRNWDRTPDGEPLTSVALVTRRQRGGVWLVAKSRFFFCDGETLTPLNEPCPLASSVALSSIYEDSRGRLWAGSDAGLAVLETNGRWLNDRSGFQNHHVFAIGEDWKGTVWINTARGVFRFLANYRVEAFTPEDGLADWETNAHGFFSDSRGEIWIGTINGLTQYSPAVRSPNTEPPRLVVENVRMPSRSLEFPSQLELGWNERTLVFNIAVLSYRNRNRTAYRARMAGLENDWLPLRSLNELRYSNLPAGHLQLLLQPVNESGIWGQTVTLPIHVHPPFWMTLWFRLGAGIVLLAAALGVYRWRTRLLRRRNRELEREVGKRTAELEYLATYDPLTALFNRRAVLALLEREMQPERGSNRQLGCIMIDLNRFKMVNDTLGHPTGDQVLKEMTAKIQECLRQGDALGRLGFAVETFKAQS